jgi:hypothetical protein
MITDEILRLSGLQTLFLSLHARSVRDSNNILTLTPSAIDYNCAGWSMAIHVEVHR